uniref:Glutamyl-tRNA(Gln) amidotransferase subunit C, mitochondrial n=1 Tax=Mola mola TaxID=94237 RepID=A0A3Q3XIS8_MOLML
TGGEWPWFRLSSPFVGAQAGPTRSPPSAQIPADLVDKLERLALLDFRTKQGLVCLEKAIRHADQLLVVDTSAVEPMDSVLEDRALNLRDDTAMEGDCAEELLRLSKNIVEEYFVAPPGKIVRVHLY